MTNLQRDDKPASIITLKTHLLCPPFASEDMAPLSQYRQQLGYYVGGSSGRRRGSSSRFSARGVRDAFLERQQLTCALDVDAAALFAGATFVAWTTGVLGAVWGTCFWVSTGPVSSSSLESSIQPGLEASQGPSLGRSMMRCIPVSCMYNCPPSTN